MTDNYSMLRYASDALKHIADHAEHEHNAPCVAYALGEWFSTLVEWLCDEDVVDIDDVETLLAVAREFAD